MGWLAFDEARRLGDGDGPLGCREDRDGMRVTEAAAESLLNAMDRAVGDAPSERALALDDVLGALVVESAFNEDDHIADAVDSHRRSHLARFAADAAAPVVLGVEDAPEPGSATHLAASMVRAIAEVYPPELGREPRAVEVVACAG